MLHNKTYFEKKGSFSGQVTVKTDTHEGFCSEGAFSSSLNLPRELAPKYLTS